MSNRSMSKAVLFIIDGIGDLPTPRTPLQSAKKPNFDFLAKNGICGLMSTIAPGIMPGSDVAHLQLLGYDPEKYYCGRGPLEALGLGLSLREGDVAFRANFATLKHGRIIDRRAGRITTQEARKLENIINMRIDNTQVIFKSSTEHRGALILRGSNLSANVSSTDTHHEGEMKKCVALDSSEQAKKTAEIINRFNELIKQKLENNEINKARVANKKLPANFVLLRGAGYYRKIPSAQERFRINTACVAGGALYKGVAHYLGMEVIDVKGATATSETNLTEKANATIKALEHNDLVFLHVKAVDSFGHDGNFEGKKKMIEKIDREILPHLIKNIAKNNSKNDDNRYLIITGDHSTPCIRKAHSGHEVPILIYGKNERVDDVNKFDEISCMNGGLGHLRGKDVMPLVLNLIEKGKMYGS